MQPRDANDRRHTPEVAAPAGIGVRRPDPVQTNSPITDQDVDPAIITDGRRDLWRRHPRGRRGERVTRQMDEGETKQAGIDLDVRPGFGHQSNAADTVLGKRPADDRTQIGRPDLAEVERQKGERRREQSVGEPPKLAPDPSDLPLG